MFQQKIFLKDQQDAKHLKLIPVIYVFLPVSLSFFLSLEQVPMWFQPQVHFLLLL